MEAPPRCARCLALGEATRPGVRILRSKRTGVWLCEEHAPGAEPRKPLHDVPLELAPSTATAGHNLAIQTSSLSKRFGEVKAVDGLSFEVARGRVVGFVGPNGAGKTTTIRMLMGLVRPTSGHALVLGESIRRPSRYLSRVGALIESPAFYPALSGRRNLRALARLSGLHAAADRVDDLLAQVGLSEWGDATFKSYSLGMKQRLGIGASLLSDPDLLILDEPTNGLDPAGIHEVRDFLRGLGRTGKTVFVSSHLMAEVQRMCDDLVVLRKGRLVYQGSVEGALALQPGILAAPEDPRQLEPLLQLCAALGHAARVQPDGSVLVQAPPEWAAELNRQAMRAGIALALLQPRALGLEESVLEMTGAGTP